MNNFRELKVWQKAIDLATSVYQISDHFPKSEQFGLTSQIRRSSVSISSNIAEGAGRNSNLEFSHFLSIAYGSTCEMESQLEICKNLGFITIEQLQAVLIPIDEIQKMIFALRNL